MQDHLRAFFGRWGRPYGLRVDNGGPWGSSHDLPPQLALWLLGLAVEVIWIPPCRPQANGVVERSQGTGKRWAEPGRCLSPEELQARLDEADRHQREDYPYEGKRSRWEVYPTLACSGRPYSRAWEEASWDWSQVQQHLAAYELVRCVNASGRLSLYDRLHYVGRRYAGQEVFVSYDPDTGEWVIQDGHGEYLTRVAARWLTAERVRQLTVTTEW